MANRRVLVSGLPRGTTETQLVIHFQSARISGGGDIEKVELIEGRQLQAVITFEEEEAASRVIQHGSHCLQNCNLQVTRVPSTGFTPNQGSELDSSTVEGSGFPGQSEDECYEDSHGFSKRRYSRKPSERGITAAAAAANKRQKTMAFKSSENEHDVSEHCTVKVTGLPDGVSEDLVWNYFENTRRSNGGPVSSVIMKPEIQMCLVTFECSDDAKRTVEQDRHVLNGLNLEVSLLDDSKDMKQEDEDSVDETSLVIRVSGLLPCTTEDSVLNYFENSRRSGGGGISTVEYDDGVAVVTFSEVKDVRRLLQSPHYIDRQLLTVVKEPPKRKVPPDPLRVLVQGLNSKTSEDCLRFYLEKFINVDVTEVCFGNNSNALVTFSAEPDFSRLFDGVSNDRKRLEGVKPELKRVPICSCILVRGLSEGTSEDTIGLYFENTRRSGGNNVARVERNGQGQALVYFEDPASVEAVIHRTHNLEEAQLSVTTYYPFLEESGTDPQMNRAAKKNKVKSAIDPDVISYIRDKHDTELETLLKEHNASLSLDVESSTVTISPLDESEGRIAWKKGAEIIEQFLNKFTRFKITLASETFDGVKERWEGLDSAQRSANVVVSFDGTSRLVQIIGKREDVEKVQKELREIICTVEQDTALKKSIVQSVEGGIPKARLSLLQKSGFCKRLQNEHQHLTISVDLEKEKLYLEGPKGVIQDVTVEVFKFTSKIIEKCMKIPSGIIQVLKTPSLATFVEESLKQNNIQAIVRFPQTENPNEVQIIGVNSEGTFRAEKMLKCIVHEESIDLTPESRSVLESPQWKDFKSSLTSAQGRLLPLKVGITFATDSNAIWVRGIREDVKECIGEIRNYLEVNTVLHSCVPLEYGSTKFLFEVLESKVDDIKKSLSTYCVDMRVASDKNGIEICGTAEGLEIGIPRIQKLIKAVQRDSVPVDKPGMKKFFLQGKGSKLLKSIESENHCIIVTSESAADDRIANKTEIMVEDPTGEFICSYTTPEGKKICVIKDDLTKHHVDAIVNAANEDLRHIGGLAADIVRVGGREIQTDCDDFVRDNGGVLLPGHAMATKSGKLPCKKVIHVVGPKWNDGAETKRKLGNPTKEEGYLKLAVLNALKMAATLRSIAIPAVSSGVYGFPRNLCASVIVDAVLEFCKQNPTCNLSEIHLTNKDDPTVRVFVEEIKKRFSQEKSFVDKQRAGLTNTEKRHVGGMLYARSKAGGWTGGLPITFNTPDGICITVKAGDLAKEKADILVGTASSDLNLNQNPCAKALGQAAGAILQQECTRNGPVAGGDIAVIAQPGKLNCRAVIFVICSSWKGGKGEKVLKSLVKKCLEAGEKMKATSIAFPAIGTGALQFPRDRVANIFFDAVASYSQNHPSTQLKTVKFVLFDQDIPTVKAFEAELARRVQNVPSSGEKALGFPGRPSSSKMYAFSPVKERGSGFLETNVGSLCFQVENGDITQESTDAIVIVSNPELDIARGDGAGAAILRSGGKSIQDECSLQGHQTPGSVVVTKAGRLKTGSIFHAIPLPSGDIQVTIKKCLQEAERRGISSISFPAIGTGNLGISSKSCAQAMLTVLREFSAQNPTSLHLVRTTIFQPGMLKDFRSAMKETSGEIKTGETGVFWSLVSRFKRFVGFGNMEEAIEPLLSTSESEEREMFLLIFAGCKQHLEGAKTAINDLIKDNCTRQVIENDAISGLTSQHRNHIHTLELKYHTKVSIETNAYVDRIVVRGQPEDVMNTMGEIHEIIHSVKEEEHKRSRAELLAKNVQWLFKDGSKFEECGLYQNLQIESAYEENKGATTIVSGEAKFEVDFNNMTMKDLSDSKTTEVKRIDRQGVQLPDYWASQPKDQAGKDVAVHLFQLSHAKNPQELKNVSDQFNKSCGNTILKIERVQNVALYKTYAIRRKEMDEGKGSNEKLLFHGTPGQNCEQINHKGFNRSFCGKNATLYGNGVYFAKNAAYSARPQYSPADRNGYRYMYLARVLVGEFTTGTQGLLMPPSKNASTDPTDTYDTVVDDVNNPGIFVAFYDWQCYPEYLITFQ